MSGGGGGNARDHRGPKYIFAGRCTGVERTEVLHQSQTRWAPSPAAGAMAHRFSVLPSDAGVVAAAARRRPSFARGAGGSGTPPLTRAASVVGRCAARAPASGAPGVVRGNLGGLWCGGGGGALWARSARMCGCGCEFEEKCAVACSFVCSFTRARVRVEATSVKGDTFARVACCCGGAVVA